MQAKGSKRKSVIKKVLGRLLTILAAILALAVFYLAVIVGQPAQDELAKAQQTPIPQSLLTASLPEKISLQDEIPSLLDSFPGSFMRLTPSKEISFVQGQTYDVAYGGAFARAAELTYQTDDGFTITVISYYPRDAYSLISTQGYTVSPMTGYTMLHLPAVRMDSNQDTRFHCSGSDALYLLSVSKGLTDDPSAYLKLTQLEIPLS